MPNLPENCPLCGEKMEEGYMLTDNIFWSKEKKTMITRWSAERLVHGLFKPTRLHVTNVEACRCPNCKIVLFSYEKEKNRIIHRSQVVKK